MRSSQHTAGLKYNFAAVFTMNDSMEQNEVVKSSDITLRVGLDAENVPVKIEWGASDRNNGALEECKAMAIALFDKEHRDTLRIDLWTKEMQVIEMDRFMYQVLRSLSQTYLKATQNKELAEEMARFAHYFGEKTEIVPQGE
ncbi:MAG: gliding motility protein GldC [Bacteroidota bacterium]